MTAGNFGHVPTDLELNTEFVSELTRLSIQERDEVNYDVHGVSQKISREDSDFVRRSLSSMKMELGKIPHSEKRAYNIALAQNEDFVLNDNFLLMFLRALQFDTKAAAARLVSFFEAKLELFGKEKLSRDIRVDDLEEEDDVACLESGYAQILNARDRADRAVFVLLPTIRPIQSVQNRLRAIYLVFMFALKDIETQRNGIVGIIYNIGEDTGNDREAVIKNSQLVSALPIRFSSIHYCYENEKLRALFLLAMYIFQRALRIRCRFHHGTHMEAIYTLMTFGIPSEALPYSMNGSLRLQGHQDFIRKMKATDDANDQSIDRVVVPGKFDVLLGRGKPLQKYSGNLNYHYIIEGYHEQYEAAAKGNKADLAMEIVKKIHGQGGKFLKQDDAGWFVITDEAAKSKVSHTFRNHRIAARTALKKASALAMHQNNGTSSVCASSSKNGTGVRLKARGPDDQKRRKIFPE